MLGYYCIGSMWCHSTIDAAMVTCVDAVSVTIVHEILLKVAGPVGIFVLTLLLFKYVGKYTYHSRVGGLLIEDTG